MSLPPSVLLVKRKRNEGPIEALYIEGSSRDSPKRRHTESAFVFRRLQQETEVTDGHANNEVPKLPTRTEVTGSRYLAPSQGSLSGSAKGAGLGTTPRRFLLSREALQDVPSISRKQKASQHGSNIALFIESRETPVATVAHQKSTIGEGVRSSQTTTSPTRKRPTQKARKQERIGDSMNHISEAQSQAMERHASELDSRAPPSSHDQDLANSAGDDADAMELDDDYIVDTYVRHSKDDEPRYDIHDPRKTKDEEGSIGYLVIPEADQTLWETYYDSDADSEDEQDWDSEQDDENAENYYGADYPEDEVDSEDEFGEAPYRYHRGSDEEEYGSGDEAWSDHEEARGAKSWIDVTTMKGN